MADNKGTSRLLNFVGNIPYGDKIGHFVLSGIFSFLLNSILCAKKGSFCKISFSVGSLAALIIISLEEFSQMFIRGRTFDFTDLIADFAGIFVFGRVAEFICKREKDANAAAIKL